MGIGLYIHIPFCKARCSYCDFTSYAGSESLMGPYVKALKTELEIKTKNKCISTVFIGGGTPTALPDELFADLLGFLQGSLDLADGYEFTVEGNPESMTREKISAMKRYGVNRVSMGLQTTDDLLLKNIGRIHDYETFLTAYENLSAAGMRNVSFDLITGLPGYTMAKLKDTMDKVITLAPNHISIYSLILEEGTPLSQLVAKGRVELPDEEADRAMQAYARDHLAAAGYGKYEISNYSQPGYECKHNISYWQVQDYIGVGVAAAGFEANRRYQNTPSIETYLELINCGVPAAVESTMNTEADNMEEFMFMGLRMINGISMSEFKRRFNQEIAAVYGKVMERYLKTGHMIMKGDRLCLSEAGLDISNYILSDFIL